MSPRGVDATRFQSSAQPSALPPPPLESPGLPKVDSESSVHYPINSDCDHLKMEYLELIRHDLLHLSPLMNMAATFAVYSAKMHRQRCPSVMFADSCSA